MKSLQVSAVLFAKQLTTIADFYQAVFRVEPARSEADHVHLRFGGFDLVIHQIPARFLSSASDDSPFERRERAAKRTAWAERSTIFHRPGRVKTKASSWATIQKAMCSERK
jgi:hypothetical protein